MPRRARPLALPLSALFGLLLLPVLLTGGARRATAASPRAIYQVERVNVDAEGVQFQDVSLSPAINTSGQVACADLVEGVVHPVRFNSALGAEQVIPIESPGGLDPSFDHGTALALNDVGDTVGYFGSTSRGDAVVMHYTDAAGSEALPQFLGQSYSRGTGININGDICGFTRNEGDSASFRYQAATGYTQLPTLGGNSEARGINDRGQIVGWTNDGRGPNHAFRWTEGATPELLDLGFAGTYTNSEAYGISGNGDVVGDLFFNGPTDFSSMAFLYTDADGMQPLGLLPNGTSSFAYSVNSRRQVVGTADVVFDGDNSAWYATLYTPADGLQNLNDFIDPDSGWVLEEATSINEFGQIVGVGYFGGIPAVFRLTLDTTPPNILFGDVVPRHLGPTGGTAAFFVETQDNVYADTVTAVFTYPDGTTTATVPMTRNGTRFDAQFTAPPNTTASAQVYAIRVTATDPAGNQISGSLVPLTVDPDTTPPVIGSTNINPTTFPAVGGDLLITATVTDDVAVSKVDALILLPDASTVTVPLSGPSGPNSYSAVFHAPANPTGTLETYGVTIRAVDTSTNPANKDAGTFSVDPDTQAPQVSNGMVTPTNLPATGGSTLLTVDVMDNVQVAEVTGTVTYPDSNVKPPAVLPLINRTTYGTSFQLPPNPSQIPQVYRFDALAKDSAGNETPQSCGSVTVAADTQGPVLSNQTVNPSNIGSSGGKVFFTVRMDDDVAVGGAKVIVTLPTPPGGTMAVGLSKQSSGVTSDTFAGQFSVPPNPTGTQRTFNVTFEGLDLAGNSAASLPGSFTQSADTQPPLVSNIDVTPRSLPAEGGSSVLTVDVTDDGALQSVQAVVTYPDSSTRGPITLGLISGSTYGAPINFPPNPTSAPQAYTIDLVAQDQAGNSTPATAGNVTVAPDQQEPALSSISASPTTLPAAGGTVALQMDVTDTISLGPVFFTVVFPDTVTTFSVPVTKQGNGALSDTFKGTFAAPHNPTNQPATYLVIFEGRDQAGNTASMQRSFTVSADSSAPTLLNPSALPASLGTTGGTVALSVQMQDDAGVNAATAKVTLPDSSVMMVSLTKQGSDPLDATFKGNFVAPPNPTSSVRSYPVQFVGTDKAGNSAGPVTTSFTVAADSQAPTLSGPQLTPTTVPAEGGSVDVKVTAIDDVGIQSVKLVVTNPDSSTRPAVLLSRATGDIFTVTVPIPPNATNASRSYSFAVTADDVAGNTSAALPMGSVTQAADSGAPQLINPLLNPAIVPAPGGSVAVSVSMTDTVEVGTTVLATITAPGGGTSQVTLTRQGGSPLSATYTGSYTVPANPSQADQVYAVKFTGSDLAGNAAASIQAPLKVLADSSPPVIGTPSVTPRTLPAAGGSATLTVDVTDDVAVGTVQAVVQAPDLSTSTVTLSLLSGNTYGGVLAFPANPSTGSAVYAVGILAADQAGLQTTRGGGTVAVSSDSAAPTLSNAIVNPTSLPTFGGKVFLSVDLADNAGLGSAKASVTLAGGATTVVNLSPGMGTTLAKSFTGEFSTPPNPTATTQTYSVSFSGSDAAGNAATPLSGGQFTVAPDTQAPDIEQIQVNPTAVGPEGGTVQIRADVTDDVGVTGVIARVTLPGGGTVDVTMDPNAEVTYFGSFAVPARPSASGSSYGIEIRALDAAGNLGTAAAGDITQAADTTAPTVNSASLNPTTLPAVGGSVAVSVDATDNLGVALAAATVTYPDSSQQPVSLALVTGSIYGGTFTLPANPTASPVSYSVSAVVSDGAGNQTPVSCGTVTVQADNAAPVLSGPSVTPATLPDTGGTVDLAVTLTDAVGIGSVTATITLPGGGTAQVGLSPQSGGTSLTALCKGSYVAPGNPTSSSKSYAVSFTGTDVAGNTVTGAGGTFSVAADTQGPVLSGIQLTPPSLPAEGGMVVLTVDATDDLGVAGIDLTLIHPDASTSSAGLALISGTTWGVTFPVGPNPTKTPATWGITLVARDSAPNTTTQTAGPVTVAADSTPPVLSNPVVGPTALPTVGGTVSFSVDVADAVGVGTAAATVTLPDGSTVQVPLAPPSGAVKPRLGPGPVGTGGFTGSFTAPLNTGAMPQTYGVSFSAVDQAGNSSAPLNTSGFTVAGDTAPPTITNAGVTPSTLPSEGGVITIQADINDPGGVGNVEATIYRPDQTTDTVPLTTQGGMTYTGMYLVPANSTAAAVSYAAVITAEDKSGNSTSDTGGTVVVAADSQPPVLSNCSVTPTTLPMAGGTAALQVDVMDNGTVALVQGEITLPDSTTVLVTLARQSGSTYTGSYQAPANNSGSDATYGVRFLAKDAAANSAAMDCGTLLVSADGTPPSLTNVQLSPTSLKSRGGTVFVTADAADASGVGAVVAVVTLPGGGTQTVTLAQASPGSYAGAFAAPANTGDAAQDYAVLVRATDVPGNTTSQSAGTATVAASGRADFATTALNYGNIHIHYYELRSVTIRNKGNGPLDCTLQTEGATFDIPALSGVSTSGVPTTNLTVPAHDKAVVKVRFIPRAKRKYTGALVINTSDNRKPTGRVKLVGTGCDKLPGGH